MSDAATATYNDALPIAKLHESKWNPRKTFDSVKLAELTASVKAKGVVTPLLVRPNANGFEIGAGHRRFRAAKAAGIETVPARIKPMTDEEFLELVVFENDEREDVHPLEEAAGYKTMMTQLGWDVGRIAARTGKSEKYVYDRVKLLALIKAAQQLFLENRITAGHAILLARLKPADQERAIDQDSGGLFEHEHALFHPDRDDEDDDRLKTRSVRELEKWIAEHVRFDAGKADAFLFPETVAAVTTAQQQKQKVVEITYEHYVQEEARAGRTLGPRSWTRADGQHDSKTCDYGVTGVVVVGPGQGEAFTVCINKEKCLVHYGKEIRERQKRLKGEATGRTSAAAKERERYEREETRLREEQRRADELRRRWEKATPKIMEAVATSVKKAPTKATGLLASILIGRAGGSNGHSKAAAELVPVGKSADDLVRHVAFLVLYHEVRNPWRAVDEFPKRAKAFGIDVRKILDEAAPVETKTEPTPGSAAKKKGSTKKGSKS